MPYRYEDLGDESFQRLCQALLAHLDATTQSPPPSQADGGHDAFSREWGELAKVRSQQVKWTGHVDRIRDPVAWLKRTITDEASNLREMVAHGTKFYLLITNIPSTSPPASGRLDRMDAELVKLGKEYGLTMMVWWRHDLDARLDAAPRELKFAYPNMLVGADAMRALIADALDGDRLTRITRLLKSAAAAAAAIDDVVGFRQGKLDGVPLRDLFVDVSARRKFVATQASSKEPQPVGAFKLIMEGNVPSRMMIHGAPGQGKSTLIQRLCQEYRSGLIGPGQAAADEKDVEIQGGDTRVVFKILLREYARWISGFDPFSAVDQKIPRRTSDSIESFAAYCLKHYSGGMSASSDVVVEIANRFPTFFALDGLDEVGDIEMRARVVKEIMSFHARAQTWDLNPLAIVTSRPSFDRLPEPTNDIFVVYSLDPLSETLRIDYLRKWARSQLLSSQDRHHVERIFRARSGEDHVRDLATNPMQLTILLYLIHQRRESIPRRRTELYADYLQSFLDRESSNNAFVMKYREELEQVTAFLGWHLQSLAESASGAGRAPRKELIRAIKHFLVDNDQDPTLVEELFTAVTVRVWALTSRVEGTFEFDVQSIREFFAARHIIDRATAGGGDQFERFRQVAARPYWANVARYMAGLMRTGEKAQLADDLQTAIEASPFRFWPRQMALTLIRDGVFDSSPKPRLRLLQTTMDPLGVRISLRDVESGETPLVPSDRGGDDVHSFLAQSLDSLPLDPLALERARLLRLYSSPKGFAQWWLRGLRAAKNTAERTRWLEIGAAVQVGSSVPVADTRQLSSGNTSEASMLLTAGVTPEADSELAEQLVGTVLEGLNWSANSAGSSKGAALARVVDLPRLIERADVAPTGLTEFNSEASSLLAKFDASAAKLILSRRRGAAGQQGTTLLLSELADTVRRQFGRSWLANELAVVAASSSRLRTGHGAPHDWVSFGVKSMPSALIRDLRANSSSLEWWTQALATSEDSVDLITWCVSVITCASWDVLPQLIPKLAKAIDDLPPQHFASVVNAVALLAANPNVRALPRGCVVDGAALSVKLAGVLSFLAGETDWVDELSQEAATILASNTLINAPLVDEVWANIVRAGTVDGSEFEVIAASGPSSATEGIPRFDFPMELVGLARTDLPWGLLTWIDRVVGASSDPSLADVAAEAAWFAPAD